MSLFMTQFSYTAEAWRSLVKSPEDRRVPVKTLMEKLGCRLVDLYYCFGDFDGVVIFEAPDEATATAVVLAATTGGHMKGTKTTVLFSVENAMNAMGKASDIVYPAPTG